MSALSAFLVHVLDLVSGAAGMTLASFILLVALDDFLGAILAMKDHVFSFKKLPSWLATQFGTKEALVLGGMIATAFLGQLGLISVKDISSLQGIESLSLGLIKLIWSAATVGAGYLAMAVIADVAQKLAALTGQTPPPPAPAVDQVALLKRENEQLRQQLAQHPT